MKLLAVDGNSILNRAYYGIRLLSTKEGIFTNGIYGFLTILLRMEQEVQPDAVAITFDMRAPTFRHKMYAGYKAQRKGMPNELAQQMPYLKELLQYLGYTIVEKEGYEADDLLGTLSRVCCAKGDSCVIATGDRDSFQLINDCIQVRLASTKGGKPQADLIDTAAVREKYGVEPLQLIDVKALMGDSSDNVPGVAGIGEKGALALIQAHGNLDYIYDNLESLPIKDGMRKKLTEGREMAMLSRDLVTIDCHVPIEDDLARFQKQAPDHTQAYPLMARLELFSLLDRFGVQAADSAPASDTEEPQAALSIAFQMPPAALLAEGKTVDVLFAMNGKEIEALCVIGAETLYMVDAEVEQAARNILLAPALKRTNHTKQLHHYCTVHGFAAEGIVFDAEIAGYILNPTASGYSIARMAGEYGVASLPLDNLFAVHTALLEECAVFSQLADILLEKLSENHQMKLFHEIELPLAQVLADMEHIGFAVDTHGLEAYGKNLDIEIERLHTDIYRLAGEEFNLNSPKQLGAILFEKLGLPAKKKTKTGYSTNADVLESLQGKHPIIDHILEYRTLSKLKSTYVDGLRKVVAPDGRIHTSFQQTLTRTGRISSTEPNLQNIPIRTPLGSELRRFFQAKEGCLLVDADYSQIELRVLADIAEDDNMIAAFQAGEDIHLNTAAQVFDLPPLMVTPLMRSRAKAVNFGIVYGIGAYSLSQDIGVSVAEADRYIKNYLQTYSGVRQYMEDTIAFATEYGYVKTVFGRRRYLPELASSHRPTKEFGKRVAMNTPIQGTAADIIKIAMVRVWNRLRREQLDAQLVLQVHDELIIETPVSEQEIVQALVREEMEHAVTMRVPMEADVHSGKTWKDAK